MQAVFTLFKPHRKRIMIRKEEPLRITTMMVRSPPCSFDSVRSQTWPLNPEGVAEMKRKKDHKRKNEKRKGACQSYFGCWWKKSDDASFFFQDKIACLVACTLLDKHSTHFIICKKLGSTQI